MFDAHELDVADNLEETTEVAREARRYGAGVEGEIEGIQGVEDGIGSDEASVQQSLEVAVDFITRTGVDCFAPAIGDAHGSTPPLRFSTTSASRTSWRPLACRWLCTEGRACRRSSSRT